MHSVHRSAVLSLHLLPKQPWHLCWSAYMHSFPQQLTVPYHRHRKCHHSQQPGNIHYLSSLLPVRAHPPVILLPESPDQAVQIPLHHFLYTIRLWQVPRCTLLPEPLLYLLLYILLSGSVPSELPLTFSIFFSSSYSSK